MLANGGWDLTLILLTWAIWRDPTNASKWWMGFNSAFKRLMQILSFKIAKVYMPNKKNRKVEGHKPQSLKITQSDGYMFNRFKSEVPIKSKK